MFEEIKEILLKVYPTELKKKYFTNILFCVIIQFIFLLGVGIFTNNVFQIEIAAVATVTMGSILFIHLHFAVEDLERLILFFVIALNFIFYPGIFLFSGTMYGSVALFFTFGVVTTFILLNPKAAKFVVAFALVFTAAYIAVYYKYKLALSAFLGSDFNNFAILLGNILLVSISLGILLRKILKEFDMEIDKEQELLYKIQAISSKDVTTHLYNEKYLISHLYSLTDEIKKNNISAFNVILVSIDNYAEYKDNLTKTTFDFIINRVVEVLKTSVSEQGIVARQRENTYVCVLTVEDEIAAFRKADQLRLDVSEISFTDINQNLNVTVSCGVAKHASSASPDMTMAEAHNNMMISRNNGGNQTTWHDGEMSPPCYNTMM